MRRGWLGAQIFKILIANVASVSRRSRSRNAIAHARNPLRGADRLPKTRQRCKTSCTPPFRTGPQAVADLPHAARPFVNFSRLKQRSVYHPSPVWNRCVSVVRVRILVM